MDSSNSEKGLASLIPGWLALTQGAEVPVGLSREEAFQRARELRRMLRDGRVSRSDLEMDEDLKDVLHALVVLLAESRDDGPSTTLGEADCVYQLIRRIRWEDDDFGERRALLRKCAEIGWRSAGLPISETGFPHPSSDPDGLSSTCRRLRDAWNSNPRFVAVQASSIYWSLRAKDGSCGLFDEADYFLGETALLAASALRILGEREETETWLQRAEAGFRHTVNPGPLLAQCAYVRLALQYDKRRYQEVLDLLPSLLESFGKFGMRAESAKTRFMEAMTLKECSRRGEAFEKFTALRDTLDEAQETGLLGQVHLEIGAYHAWKSRYQEALGSYQKALTLLSRTNRPHAVAHLKMTVGETLQFQGRLASAVEAYRDGIAAYIELRTSAYAAYGRIVLAEALIELGRNREAEWEILAALPTIEEQRMVPEGFAAVALLRESVRRRKTDPNALRDLREHLQSNA